MNVLDLLAITVMVISSSIGLYQGFIVSFAGFFAFFASFIGAFIFYPIFSRFLVAKTSIMSLITDLLGTAANPPSDIGKISVTSFNQNQLNDLMMESDLPTPFLTVLKKGFESKAYEKMGIDELGAFLSTSISNIILNAISFLILFFIIRIIIAFIISGIKYIVNIPVLKQFDSLLGLGFGLLRGFLFNFVIFALLIIGMSFAPVSQIYDLIETSYFADIFYNSNFIISLLNSVI